jgi:hypothetical protein
VDAYDRLQGELTDIGWSEEDARRVVQNTRGAINQGAYVLQKLRSDMGDVHGSHPVVEALVYDSVKWAALTIRLLNS